MSARGGMQRSELWQVRMARSANWHLFAGSLSEVVAYINRLHCSTGMQHTAREFGN